MPQCEDYPCCGHEPGTCPASQDKRCCIDCGKIIRKGLRCHDCKCALRRGIRANEMETQYPGESDT